MSTALAVRPFRKRRLGRIVQRLKGRYLRAQKWLYWHALPHRLPARRIVLVVGCQRSGTSLLVRIFERDLRTTVLFEDSPITGVDGQRLRLKPVAEVNQIMARFLTPLVVAKPLVESQRTRDLLEQIPGSKAIWMIRHYRDVANSSIHRFRGQVEHLRTIVRADPGDWRAERVTQKTRMIVGRLFSDSMPRHDAAALMWYARNVLFFDQQLDTHPAVWMGRYEDVTSRAKETMEDIYQFLGVKYPRWDITGDVDSKSVGLGRDLVFDGEVEELCESLLRQFEQCRHRRREGSDRATLPAVTVDDIGRTST